MSRFGQIWGVIQVGSLLMCGLYLLAMNPGPGSTWFGVWAIFSTWGMMLWVFWAIYAEGALSR